MSRRPDLTTRVSVREKAIFELAKLTLWLTVELEAFKAEGGITFAQDDSARYDSMPQSAVAASCVDLVLSAADIAEELARIAKHPFVAGQPLVLSAYWICDRRGWRKGTPPVKTVAKLSDRP